MIGKIVGLTAAIVSVTFLGACHSEKDATEKNFSRAVNAQLQKQCSIVPVSGGDEHWDWSKGHPPAFPIAKSLAIPREGSLLQLKTQADADKYNEIQLAPYAALVSVGLLSEADGHVRVGLGSVPGKIYSLTDAGRSALLAPDSRAFCAGHYKIQSITSYTQPGNMMGVTMSVVDFTYVPDGVAAWANSARVRKAFPELASYLGEQEKKGKTTLILKNNGWESERIRLQ